MSDVDKKLMEAAGHLLRVWGQYSDGCWKMRETNGVMFLPHAHMSAGEDAADFLSELGLGRDTGWEFEVNEKGRELMGW